MSASQTNPDALVSQALAAFETALKSKDGPLHPLTAQVAMLNSRYESEKRKWDESLRLAIRHETMLAGDPMAPDKPGIAACVYQISEALKAQAKRQTQLRKVFWSAFITVAVQLVATGIWIAFHLPMAKP